MKPTASHPNVPGRLPVQRLQNEQYRQIGNAVPCRFAQAVAMSVRDVYLGGS